MVCLAPRRKAEFSTLFVFAVSVRHPLPIRSKRREVNRQRINQSAGRQIFGRHRTPPAAHRRLALWTASSADDYVGSNVELGRGCERSARHQPGSLLVHDGHYEN